MGKWIGHDLKLKQFIHFNYVMSKMLNDAVIFGSDTHQAKIINTKTIKIPELITLYVIISQEIKIIFKKVHSLWPNMDWHVQTEVCIWLFLQEKF